MWFVYALFAALFAGTVPILAKLGLENINSNLAVALRTIVVLIMAWSIVFISGKQNEIASLEPRNFIFLGLSGIATGLSWLFFYRALQIGDASRVIPVDKFSIVIGMVLAFVVLQETVTLKVVIGGILITLGTLVLIF